jgi:glycosyltransferase involved in cell wall biosynthesis
VSGLLVAPGDTGAFVTAVVRVLRDPTLAAGLSLGARERIQREFGWWKLARSAEEAYVQQP